MSGICGAFALDGGEVRQTDLDAMTAQLARRGPDGTRSWASGSVGLGHTLLATTPEALVEKLPLTDPETGCTITADCRLDNREELIAGLGLSGEERVIGDGELILRAYLRWGEECPAKLLGDFAFAIWDPRDERLFCARDHMGMRQLIYHHKPGQLFVFATEAEAVLQHSATPRQINEGRIADFLDGMEGIDLTSTFFLDLFRLPPAHSLTVSEEQFSVRRYWALEMPPELKLPSDEAYSEAFLAVFKEAVRCRLRSARPIGAMVSGGLDSSSVAAVAAGLIQGGKVHSFSAIGPDGQTCSETRAIRSVLAFADLEATTVNVDNLDAYREELQRAVEEIGDPFDAHMNLVRSVYIAARRKGVNAVLDGVGGDLALMCGNRIAQLIRSKRFGEAVSEARREAEFWGLGRRPVYLLVSASWAALAPRSLRRIKQSVQAWWNDRQAMKGRSALTFEFAVATKLSNRRRAFRTHLSGASPADRSYRGRAINHPHMAAARERYERIASRVAVEARDPFLDVRVLHFCLSLPPEQIQSGGWTKHVLRRAMHGILPEEVAWRRGKDHLGLRFTEALIAENEPWTMRWARERVRLLGLSSRLAGGPDTLPDPSAMDPKIFIELFALACWLSHNVVPND